MGALLLPELRLQLAAVTLAEELNFTRAAERLRITQPALSKQIAELENQVGFIVFHRNQRHVELSDGQLFIRGCRDSLALLEKAVRIAKSTRDEVEPLVTIGHCPYIDPWLLSALLAVQLPLYPGLRLRMESMFALDLAHGVIASELDLAIISEPSENPLLTLALVASAPLCVAMPVEHPATRKQSVSMADFGGVGWMIFPKKAHPVVYDRLMEAARLSGSSPVQLHHYVNPQQAIQLMQENFGVAFLAKGIAEQFQNTKIAVRPLAASSLQVSSYLVLRADQSSRVVNEF
jgi:DNA-binding transcriptional LysR family regulator